jgi:hypothetical protein
MTVITQVNTRTRNLISDAINEALADVADQFGLNFKIDEVKSDFVSVSGKFRLVVGLDEGGNVVDKDKESFENKARSLGIPLDWYLKEYSANGWEYRITDLLPSRPKNCVQSTRRDGKVFIAPPSYIHRHI